MQAIGKSTSQESRCAYEGNAGTAKSRDIRLGHGGVTLGPWSAYND